MLSNDLFSNKEMSRAQTCQGAFMTNVYWL